MIASARSRERAGLSRRREQLAEGQHGAPQPQRRQRVRRHQAGRTSPAAAQYAQREPQPLARAQEQARAQQPEYRGTAGQ